MWIFLVVDLYLKIIFSLMVVFFQVLLVCRYVRISFYIHFYFFEIHFCSDDANIR